MNLQKRKIYENISNKIHNSYAYCITATRNNRATAK